MPDLKEWLFEQQRKKYRYFYQNIFRNNLSKYEEESLNKVFGRLQQIEDTLKFMGVSRKERIAVYDKIQSKPQKEKAGER